MRGEINPAKQDRGNRPYSDGRAGSHLRKTGMEEYLKSLNKGQSEQSHPTHLPAPPFAMTRQTATQLIHRQYSHLVRGVPSVGERLRRPYPIQMKKVPSTNGASEHRQERGQKKRLL